MKPAASAAGKDSDIGPVTVLACGKIDLRRRSAPASSNVGSVAVWRWLVPCLLAYSAVFLPSGANACGGAAQQFFHHSTETNKERLEDFFEEQQCIEDLRFGPDSVDPLVAMVLINAANASVDQHLFENVLTRFNCIAQIRRRSPSIYQTIIDYVGEDRYAELCPHERLSRVYVVSANGGANLRAAPDINGEKIGAVAQGSVANDGTPEGEWIFVTTYVGEGYMHESTLRLYLPPADLITDPAT